MFYLLADIDSSMAKGYMRTMSRLRSVHSLREHPCFSLPSFILSHCVLFFRFKLEQRSHCVFSIFSGTSPLRSEIFTALIG